MSICGDNENLKKLKELQGTLDSKLQAGQAELAALKADMTSMRDELTAFKPEIPELANLQAELENLNKLISPVELRNQLDKLKKDFGAALPDFDSLLADLGLSSFPPTIDTSAICDKIPNIELDASGEPVEKSEPPKVANEVAKEPEKKIEVPTDFSKISRSKLNEAYSRGKNQIYLRVRGAYYAVFPDEAPTGIGDDGDTILRKKPISPFGKLILDKLYSFTIQEMWSELSDNGGGDYDELEYGTVRLNELRKGQKALLEQFKKKSDKELGSGTIEYLRPIGIYPSEEGQAKPTFSSEYLATYSGQWDFIKEGKILAREYDALLKGKHESGKLFSEISYSFDVTATESVDRRKKKIKKKNTKKIGRKI